MSLHKSLSKNNRGTTLLLLIATSPAWAQSDAAESQNLLDLIQQGGWAMWPLGFCSLGMFFLFFYGWKESALSQFIPQSSLQQTSEQLRQRDFANALTSFQNSNTLLSRAFIHALPKARPEQPDANREKVELVLSERLEAGENQISQWINYLNVVASVAPMIGLLGTVSGMISAFQTISHGGMGRPELLAGDIGEALITTATGLVIGIPAMIGYFVLRNRLNNAMTETFQIASDLVDDLSSSAEQ